MTEAEAINILQLNTPFVASKEANKAVDMAIEALEKQVPKKIIYRKQNYGTPYLCCECEADQTPTEFFREDGSEPKEKHTYCWKCGQKLDWGEVR